MPTIAPAQTRVDRRPASASERGHSRREDYRRKVLFQPDNAKKYGSGSWPPAYFYPTVVRYTK